jgi:hypothetical protein
VIKKIAISVLLLAVGYGFVRNLLVSPGSALAGLVVLALLGYLLVRGWPLIRGDVGRFHNPLRRGKHTGGADTL